VKALANTYNSKLNWDLNVTRPRFPILTVSTLSYATYSIEIV